MWLFRLTEKQLAAKAGEAKEVPETLNTCTAFSLTSYPRLPIMLGVKSRPHQLVMRGFIHALTIRKTIF